MSSSREMILARIRAALRTAAPRPAEPAGVPVWPPVDDPLTTFCAEFVAVKGEIVSDLSAFLSEFSRIASHVAEVPGSVPVREAELGVTGCDCLIARTGSIAISTRSAGGRVLSVLPPVHLVIARRAQIVPDLETAIRLWRDRYGVAWPSNLCIITGPSRTADIEKILVMGAHGPKRLALYFAD